MTGNEVRVFAGISKVDEEQRMVYGYASTTSLDSQNERISKTALEKALPDYMRFANIREMHQNSAVGTAESATIDDKGLYLQAHVVDDVAWKKVKAGVYKGFSIGGKSLSKVNDEITALKLSEISLVDRPANPECVIDLYKSEDYHNGSDNMNLEKQEIENELEVPASEDVNLKEEKENVNSKASPSDSEKSEPVTNLKKGMYEVAQLASMLQQLDNLQEMTEWEAQNEGDNSQVPAQLKENVKALAETLRAMVEEETQEISGDSDDDDITEVASPEALDLSDKTGDIAKAGARHSSADMQKVQGMHDTAVELGASCGSAEKSDSKNDIQKIDELNDLLKIAKAENTELKAKIEELSKTVLPAKGVQKVVSVSKEQDNGLEKVEEQPRNAMDAIKKVHSKGPSFVINGMRK